MWSKECWIKGNTPFPSSTGRVSVNTAPDAVGHPCCHGSLLAQAQLTVHQNFPGFFSRAALQAARLQPVTDRGFLPLCVLAEFHNLSFMCKLKESSSVVMFQAVHMTMNQANSPEPADQEPFPFLRLVFCVPWANHVTSLYYDFLICKGI